MEQLTGVLSRLLAFDKDQLPQLDLEFQHKAELIEGLSADQYFADRNRINSSSLKNLLRSKRYFLDQWKGGDDEKDEKESFKFGRAAHMALLEPNKFREMYVVEPEFIGLTKDGKPTKSLNSLDVKKQKEDWLAKQKEGAIILTEKELKNLIGVVECTLEHPIASNMMKNGIAEATIKWTDRLTGVMCRGRPDFITFDPDGSYHLVDFKTTQNVREGFFDNDIARFKYNLSMAFYADGLMEKYGKLPSTISYFAVEKESPYDASVVTIDDDDYATGKKMYQDALLTYKKCLLKNEWPPYSSTARMARSPQWAKDYIPMNEELI